MLLTLAGVRERRAREDGGPAGRPLQRFGPKMTMARGSRRCGQADGSRERLEMLKDWRERCQSRPGFVTDRMEGGPPTAHERDRVREIMGWSLRLPQMQSEQTDVLVSQGDVAYKRLALKQGLRCCGRGDWESNHGRLHGRGGKRQRLTRSCFF